MLRIVHLFRFMYVMIGMAVVIVVRIVDFGNWCLACFVGFVAILEIVDVVCKVHRSTSRVG